MLRYPLFLLAIGFIAVSNCLAQGGGTALVRLSIQTDPPGATVELNKKRIGETPLDTLVSQRDHILLIRKRGYVEFEETITMSQGQGPIFHKLERAALLYIISSPDSARIEINGDIVSDTPLLHRPLRAGPHTVKVMKPGYADAEKEVHLSGGRGLRLNVTLGLSSSTISDAQVPESEILRGSSPNRVGRS